jgi:hypothetical protein
MARKKMENPLEKSKKMPTFEERYEESLIKQLFESEIKMVKEKLLDENDDDEADYFEDKRIFQHQKRDGE